MRKRLLVPSLLALAVLAVAGCNDHDRTTNVVLPPAAPRGLFSITGDQQVTLVWLSNTESDVVGYRVYKAPVTGGSDREYTFVAGLPATAEEYVSYVVSDLGNGTTRFFAVAAVNRAGMESELSIDDVWDTPRPAGTGLALNNFVPTSATHFGYDFSGFARTSTIGDPTDIFYGYFVDSTGYVHQQVFVPDYSTDIQDAGYSTSLDAVDYAPDGGWSPTGTVEAVAGHNYVVWTRDDHYAKFRVTAVSPAQVVVDWAYQVDPSNRELRARPAADLEGGSARRPIVWLRR
jgi:hypothetical protein